VLKSVLEIRNNQSFLNTCVFKRLIPWQACELGLWSLLGGWVWENVTVASNRVSLPVRRPCVSRMCAMSLRPSTSYSLLLTAHLNPPANPSTSFVCVGGAIYFALYCSTTTAFYS